MLRRLALRDVAIVAALDVELGPGFTVLTGETGAGKSILIDALQLALGSRADAAIVREGASRAEVSAEFDLPEALRGWLDDAGFPPADDGGAAGAATLLIRRSVDAQGRSRAWINGSAATLAQLREAAEELVDIHGQHAWQSLTRPAAVRALLDAQAGCDTRAIQGLWQAWRAAEQRLTEARAAQDTLVRERERLDWQIGELAKLAPAEDEWEPLNAEHQRLAHGQALLDGARTALQALSEADDSAAALTARALDAIDEVLRYDAELAGVAEVLRGAQAQLDDAAHTLAGYLGRREPDPERLAELDGRIAAWVSLARRYRRTPAELPALLASWKAELARLDAAADLAGLEREAAAAAKAWRAEADRLSRLRRKAAPQLAQAVTQAMQPLGMAGGRFEVAVLEADAPQPHGHDMIELRVAGHAGSTPRALAKVASGGELSRLALAIATCTAPAAAEAGGTLIFDEIDSGVGGAVGDAVGRLMKQLGSRAQVLAVTHLAQVAACADRHFVVSKALQGTQTLSQVAAVDGEARVAEVARMLGGERLSGMAHAQALLGGPQPQPKSTPAR